MTTPASRLPTYFISHGGGPWPYVPEMRASMRELEDALVAMVQSLPTTPRAILMVSGHWEEHSFAVMGSAQPPMLYDYYGFPEHTYHVVYAAPGAPELAARTAQLIADAGLPTAIDPTRGFDHGVFAPMQVMYPHANVPVYQVALHASLDPAAHIALGRALAPLRDEGVLIVGSGLSYHNLRSFGPPARQPSEAFDAWLQSTLLNNTQEARNALLTQWAQAPGARLSHPREDHLIPLMVAVGAAEDEIGACVYHETMIRGGVTASSFRFGSTHNPQGDSQ
jgi:aromatic ring-opening dioxygenase catalytic subunit (LigB family)